MKRVERNGGAAGIDGMTVKELNLVSWNDRDPKYDIREWSPDGTTMGKGVTLTAEELDALRKLLEQLAARY
jgi:hypothetical protein